MNRPVNIGLLPIFSDDPSQNNETSVRSRVRTTRGVKFPWSRSAAGRLNVFPQEQSSYVFGGVGDKYGESIVILSCTSSFDDRRQAATSAMYIEIWGKEGGANGET